MPAQPRREPVDAAPSLDEVADELYGLPPEEFTAARTRYEKEARQRKDRELAASIKALAKPSVTAWLANQLVRRQRAELEPLLELGAGLREATASLAGDDLRRLSRQQHELVYALVQQARQLAKDSGRSVSDDTIRGLEDTLHAALADEQAAQQLLAGRLITALQHYGFGGSDLSAAPVPKRAEPSAKKDTKQAQDEEQLRRVERELADAQSALRDASAARDEVQAQAAEADRAAEAAQVQIEELTRQLEEAKTAAVEAAKRRRELDTALQKAERAAAAAERQLADVEARRDRLTGA